MPPVMFSVVTKYHKGRHSLFLYNSEIFYAFTQDILRSQNGSILITKDGTLGKVALVQGLNMPATLNAGVFNVKIKDPETIDVDYVYQYLAAPFLMKYANAKSTGGTIKHLNQNILIDFPVLLPRKREQVKLAELLNGLDNTITLHQRKLEKLQELKKGYLQKMFC